MDSKDLAAVQKLVNENPVLSSFFLHKLGNILTPTKNYADLLDQPNVTEPQRQKYVANIKQSVERVFEFLRECNIDHEFKRSIDYTDDSGD